jgi:hypothetical protein
MVCRVDDLADLSVVRDGIVADVVNVDDRDAATDRASSIGSSFDDPSSGD